MEINTLTLYEPSLKKIRLGKDYDGGYIICEIPDIEYDLFISAGINNDISFEEKFCEKYNTTSCYAFDGTINDIKINNKNIKFIKKNIGTTNDDNVTNLYSLINKNQTIFLKMDIEGAEFDWI